MAWSLLLAPLTQVVDTAISSGDCAIWDNACIERQDEEQRLYAERLELERQKMESEQAMFGVVSPTVKWAIIGGGVIVVVVTLILVLRKR